MKRSGSDFGLSPGPSLAHSPSFNEYSSGTMAEIAARVVSEFADDTYYYEHNHNDNDVLFSSAANDVVPDETELEKLDDDEDDSSFEFPVPRFSPVSADEIFNNGQIRPLFPLFNTDLFFADTDWRDGYNFDSENRSILQFSDSNSLEPNSVRLPLKKLMISERETSVTDSPSCSSSEADDLDGVAPETYCVWDPAKEDMKKKSKSTGSSKRWKIRDLLYRSHSDGGDAFVVLSSKQQQYDKKAPEEKAYMKMKLKKNSIRESDRKRFPSPYRQDPVGFFDRMNGLSRTIQPF